MGSVSGESCASVPAGMVSLTSLCHDLALPLTTSVVCRDIKRFQALSDLLNREAAEKIALGRSNRLLQRQSPSHKFVSFASTARTQSLLAKGGDVNLNGLTPAEASNLTDRRLIQAKAAGDRFLRVALIGAAPHHLSISQHRRISSGPEKVRPLVEGYLRGRHHSVIQDPNDRDHLIVAVNPHGSSDMSHSSREAPVSDEWSRALD